MDKNAIKKFAVWARRELIERVSQKAMQYGITQDNIIDATADSVGGKVLTDVQKNQRRALISQMNNKGFEEVMEEVAYTWFNRFIALRFMEVNGYLPTRVRVFTNADNRFEPQILEEALHLDLDGLDMEKVYQYKEDNDKEELYKYLLITQCNALSSILPGMFQRISDYTELLLPDNLLRKGRVIEQMISLIPEEDWKDAVQIIGWLYQYYNAEKKDEVFAALKKNVKITKENIPAATQLFTPDWIVRYMVENSLGRLWVEGHPNDELKAGWKYYLEEAEQEPEVRAQLIEIRKEYASMTPEQIKCIDPCCGSGHILAYLFDVLVQIYESYGYTTREAVESIVKNNLYGLDIDDRAAQLAYFAVMMKARQYDRRFFGRQIQPNVYAIRESNGIDKYALDYFCNGDAKLQEAMDSIITEMHDAKEYGSILNITPVDFAALYARFNEVRDDISMSKESVLNNLLPLVQVAEALAQKYDVVTTNPPYMGSKGMKDSLSTYIQSEYPDGKGDLYAAFIIKCLKYLKNSGFAGLLTPYVWLYLSSFENLRHSVLQSSNISSLIQLEYNAFEAACVPVSTYILRKTQLDSIGRYIQLASFKGWDNQEPHVLDAIKDFSLNYCFEALQSNYKIIDGQPIAYWLSNSIYKVFETSDKVVQYGVPRQGLITGDNNTYMRLWHEVSSEKIDFNCLESGASTKKWFPHSKGGAVRRWYGNNEYVVNWENGGLELKNFKDAKGKLRSRPQNEASYFKTGITWSDLTISWFSARFVPNGFIFDGCGPTLSPKSEDNLLYICGYFNSWVFQEFLNITCQGMHYSNGVIGQLPIIIDSSAKPEIEKLVSECISVAKDDWDESETSWDFQNNFLCKSGYSTINEAVNQYKMKKSEQESLLQKDEDAINERFASIFEMEDVVPSKGISAPTLNIMDESGLIRQLISYAVGCMFGRYSLDADGLVYAGGEWDNSKYTTYPADKDNIIPICDDEYFDDDMVGRFVKFIETVYGSDTLEENLKFIADALGGKGQPREVIRNYFLNDFYKDHCKIYQKRPIYWLFDSGKKNGFKALIYMHRYQPDTIARIRTDYVHEQQSRYRTAIADMENRIAAAASTSERVKLNKALTKLNAQDTELRTYEEKIHHLADQMISIDLDDGVKVNYAKFQDVLAKIK